MPISTVYKAQIDHIQILDEHGRLDEKLAKDTLTDDDVLFLYEQMNIGRNLDEIAFKLQRSGRMGTMDDKGFVKIVDRKKDMILVSGFNVYPNEIEDVVSHHPGVLEAAVVGVPDEHTGEAVKLFVVRKDPTLTESALREYLKDKLTGYKRPKFIEFRQDLPKTNVGKILRRALRDEARGKAA